MRNIFSSGANKGLFLCCLVPLKLREKYTGDGSTFGIDIRIPFNQGANKETIRVLGNRVMVEKEKRCVPQQDLYIGVSREYYRNA